MRKVILFLFCFHNLVFAQVGIGTINPDPTAKLEVASVTQGFLPPRMTSTQRTGIANPATGLMVYQTDGTAGLYYYSGSAWIYIINSSTNTLPISSGGTGASTASSARANLGATTIGSNLFTAQNPGAESYLKANADNTASFLDASDFRNSIGAVGKVTGSWTLQPGANLVGFTVPAGNSYVMWVNGNIPNGIVTWNATVTISNTNVPVVGNQYAWYYSVGNNLVLTSIPSQITGTNNSIVTTTSNSSTTNTFQFGITNNSGSQQTVTYGYITL